MYVIVVYDIGVERVNHVRIFLKKYLNWVQNSAFEGELTEAEFMKIKAELEEMIDHSNDCIIIYKLRDKKFVDSELIGTARAEIGQIV